MNTNRQKDIQNDKSNGYNNPYPSVYSNIRGNSQVKDKNQKEILKDSVEYVIKRTEKLSTAIYMITSLVSDTEPIKWTLRKKSIELTLELYGVRSLYLSEQNNALLNSVNLINEILSFLNISNSVSIISEMNFSVLRDEYNELRNSIIQNDSKEEKENVLIKEILMDGEEERELISRTFNKGQNNYENVLYNKNKGQKHSANSLKGSSAGLASHKRIVGESNGKNKKLDRKQTIKDIIKQKKEVTIKDISNVINGCSEKTIQRELMSLVRDNIVKKTGEKRWSRYSFA